ncbi:MAG: hypothetical protein IT292_06810 [Deltaproteobacteria bacterium]|nr:hypothetical protein [Deltaproteobacteria bacterium]
MSPLAISGSLTLITANARTVKTTEIRNEQFYDADDGIDRALSWLREHSQSLATPFKRDEFYTRFTKTEPSYGANDLAINKVATKLKLAGTNNSAIITNNTDLATPAFPITRDLPTNVIFPA